MTLNEVLAKQTFITKVPLKCGNKELSKDLKIKLMNIRIELSKFRKSFDEDIQSAIKELKPEGFDELAQKQESERTDEEKTKLSELNTQLVNDINLFSIEKGKEEVIFDKTFTIEEYNEIVDVMPEDDIDINGNTLKASDFLEVFYTLFL